MSSELEKYNGKRYKVAIDLQSRVARKILKSLNNELFFRDEDEVGKVYNDAPKVGYIGTVKYLKEFNELIMIFDKQILIDQGRYTHILKKYKGKAMCILPEILDNRKLFTEV